MPNLSERLGALLKEWFHDRGRIILSKAPRERPDLVFVVLILAFVLVSLYGYVYLKGF